MTANPEANLLVFRETRTRVSSEELVKSLTQEVAKGLKSRQSVLDALIRSGEFECGLLDVNVPGASVVADLTDQLAALLVIPDEKNSPEIKISLGAIRDLVLPKTLQVSPPEGFAYYALHPLDFAELARQWESPPSVAVIGIRSIGTTLSAVITAALKRRGISAARTTIRPSGHPYDRVTHFSEEQIVWIVEHNQRSASFLVVDEGPGLSGSSFLSVGEALMGQGVHPDRITLMGSRQPDPARLYATNGHNRWSRFRHATVFPRFYERLAGLTSLGGGAWRERLLGAEHTWPACWPQMERLKFLTPDRKSLLKFEGLGRYGQRVRDRAEFMFRAGFGPSVEDAGDGLCAYGFIPGRPLSRSELSGSVLDRLAQYCAMRAGTFRSSAVWPEPVANMVQHNLRQELQLDFAAPPELFEAPTGVVPDGRMQPEEWILSPDGKILKVDGCTHGDDHFLPGPIDVAWDLAGAVVEWDLSPEAKSALTSSFHRLSGENLGKRLSAFVLAYAVFRLAYCKMAQLALQGSSEEPRWRRAYEFYRRRVSSELRSSTHLGSGVAI